MRGTGRGEVDRVQIPLTRPPGLDGEAALHGYYPFYSTRGRLLQEAGRPGDARTEYQRALELTASAPISRFLMRRIAEVDKLSEL